MSDNVVGTTNLANRIVANPGLTDAGNGFSCIMNAAGETMGIDPNGNIYWKVTGPGAYETCKYDGHLCYYKYGVVSYDAGYYS